MLFKRGKSTPWLRCVGQEEVLVIIEEIYQGICNTHEGTYTLVNKIFRQGYYWLTLKADMEKFVKRCNVCQLYGRAINTPAMNQTRISAPWPFFQWGINILGPLPQTTGQCKFVIVAVEYFSKCPEAEAVESITTC